MPYYNYSLPQPPVHCMQWHLNCIETYNLTSMLLVLQHFSIRNTAFSGGNTKIYFVKNPRKLKKSFLWLYIVQYTVYYSIRKLAYTDRHNPCGPVHQSELYGTTSSLVRWIFRNDPERFYDKSKYGALSAVNSPIVSVIWWEGEVLLSEKIACSFQNQPVRFNSVCTSPTGWT